MLTILSQQITFIDVVDIVTFEILNATKYYIYLYVINVIYVKLHVYIYNTKRRMRYNPEKMVTHNSKLHMEA